MTTYFSYREAGKAAALATQVGHHKAQPGDPTDVDGWRAHIDADHAALKDKGDFEHHDSPEKGFLDLDEKVVLALHAAGLKWGGTYPTTKDLMHFDDRLSGDGAKIEAARRAHTANA